MTTPLPSEDRASSVQGVCLRVARLAADGTIISGADSSYVMDRFATAQYTPQMGGGQTIEQQAANGAMLVSYQTKDVLQRVTCELHMSDPDPEFSEIVAGGTIFTDDTVPATPVAIGWAPAPDGTVSNPNGCSLEIWSLAIQYNRVAQTRPYFWHVLPRVFLDPSGDRTFGNDVQDQVFSGFGNSNPGFDDGPDHDWTGSSDRPYQRLRAVSAPTGINGYVAVT